MTFTESVLRRLLKPSDPLDIPEWLAANFEVDKSSPIQGRYDLTVGPWLNEPLRDFKRPEVEDVFIKAGLQTAKTQGGIMALSWTVCEDPGPAIWYHNDKTQMKDVVNDRIFDSWERSPIIARILPPKHAGRSVDSCRFPASTVYFISSESKANRTGRPARYVFGDEIKDWERGVWPTVKKRISAWSGLGKTFGFSTPQDEDDDVDQSFNEGHQAHLHVTCPHCEKEQEILWEKNVEWDKMKTTEGEWDFPALLPTIRLECAHCRAVLARCSDPAEEMMQRYTLLRSFKWVTYNPGAPASKRSYTWSSLVNPRVPLRILVHEFLSAKNAAKIGYMQALKDFHNQRLSKSWTGLYGDDAQLPNVVDYNVAEKWPDGVAKIITCDYQNLGIVPALCWQWSRKGEARFIEFHMLDGFAAVAEMAQRLHVPHENIFVDIRFHREDVLTECQRYGWRAMMGEGNKWSYTWRKESAVGERARFESRPVSPDDGHNYANPGLGLRKISGRRVKYFKFASDPISDILTKLLYGKKIFHPTTAPTDYTYQMNSERKVRLANGKFRWEKIGKRANHARDCAKMQVAAAIYAKFLRLELEIEAAPRVDPETTARTLTV